MNIQPAQQVPANIAQSDQSLCLCHDTPDCPEQTTVEINANQLARIAELLDVLDGFLRHANTVGDHLADYLRTTGRDHPRHRTGPATTRTCSSTRSASPPTPSAPTANNR
jgi:hypothetical protein